MWIKKRWWISVVEARMRSIYIYIYIYIKGVHIGVVFHKKTFHALELLKSSHLFLHNHMLCLLYTTFNVSTSKSSNSTSDVRKRVYSRFTSSLFISLVRSPFVLLSSNIWSVFINMLFPFMANVSFTCAVTLLISHTLLLGEETNCRRR